MEENKNLEKEESCFMKLIKFISQEHNELIYKSQVIKNKINDEYNDGLLTENNIQELSALYNKLAIMQAKWTTISGILYAIEKIKSEEQLQEYSVLIEETLKKTVKVRANSEKEAIGIAEHKYYDEQTEDVVLTADDYSRTTFTLGDTTVER